MKKILLLTFLFIAVQDLFTQDFKKSLPRMGDARYHCRTTDQPELFLLNKHDNMWNFNFINSYFCIEEQYVEAKTGKNFTYFPKAELVVKSPNNNEEYYIKKTGSFYSLGKVMEVPFLRSNKLIIKYTQPRKIFRGDVVADQTTASSYIMESKMAISDFISPLQGFPAESDSIMIEVFVNESYFRSDVGILLYNSTSRHSQRQESDISARYKFRYKLSKSKIWKEASTLKLKDLPGYLQTIFRQADSRVIFLSNEYKGETISYNVIGNEVMDFIFQDNEASPTSLNLSSNETSVLSLPNPSFGHSTLYLINLPFDNYSFEVFNIVGSKVLTKKIDKTDGKEVALDLTLLKKGTYVYRLINSRGEKLATKRLVITSI